MTKLIVEMDIPRACRWYEDGTTKLCPIAEWGGGGTACSITKLFEPFDDNRPSWCPIKGVLPDEHGRLVDADACSSVLRKLENEAKTNTEKLCYGYAARMFEEAFTIIAAEKKD